MDNEELRNRFRGAGYHSPPLQPAGHSAPVPAAAPKKSKKKLYLTACLIILTLFGGLAFYWYKGTFSKDPTPSSVKGSVSLPVYYPQNLPVGFTVDEKSYSVSGEVVSFHAVNDSGDKILFTVQPRPSTFDYQTFYQKGLAGTVQFSTPAGQAAIGRAQDRLVGNLVTDVSWVLIGASTPKLTTADFQLVLEGLRKSN